MKLIYDMRILEGRMHGMSRYGLELLKALLAEDEDLGVAVLVRKPEHSRFLPQDSRLVALAVDLAPYGLRSQLNLPGVLNRLAMTTYHCPFYAPPARFKGPMVFTVHDLIHLRFPQDHGAGHRLFYRRVVKPAARRAACVFTVSEHSKKDVVELLGVPPKKVVVTPNGVGPAFMPLAEAEKAAAREKLGLPAAYVLGVGNPKPHKNLGSLIEAHRRLAAALPLGLDGLPPLALAGVKPGELAGAEPGPELVFLPHLDEPELALAYAAAEVVAVPSLYEGFGLPALEAMACGAPVLAADRASLPEVVGEAGYLCEPDPDSLAAALGEILADEKLRGRLAAAGPGRAAKFSWHKTAYRTLEIYRRVAMGKPL